MTEAQAYIVLAKIKAGLCAKTYKIVDDLFEGIYSFENALSYREESDQYRHFYEYAVSYTPVITTETPLTEKTALDLLQTWSWQDVFFV